MRVWSIFSLATSVLAADVGYSQYSWAGSQFASSYGAGSSVAALGQRPPDSRDGKWLNWGAGLHNTRWAAQDASLNSSNAASLKLSCNISYPLGVSNDPLVSDGIAYFPTIAGSLVALNYKNCSEIWKANLSTIITNFKPADPKYVKITSPYSRTTPVLDDGVLYLGSQLNALVIAIDARTGNLIDTLQLDAKPAAVITMSPTFFNGKLFMGVSSQEEIFEANVPGYKCCSFVGSMNAVTLVNNKLQLVWSAPMAPKNSGFTGIAVWGSAPPVDVSRNQIFVGTGNLYNIPDAFAACQNQTRNISVIAQGLTTHPCSRPDVYNEAVLALDADTGLVNWIARLSPLDPFTGACGLYTNPRDNCPPNSGQNADFGMAPTFVPGSQYTPYGRDTVIVGQKNGNLYALSAQAGRPYWSIDTGPDGNLGGLIWGLAVDDQRVYYTVVNSQKMRFNLTAPSGNSSTGSGSSNMTITNSAFGAANLTNGNILWETAVPNNASTVFMPTVVGDVLVTGITHDASNPAIQANGTNGSLLVLSQRTGSILNRYGLGQYAQGAVAAVREYLLFGTGYRIPGQGGFMVWKTSQ